MSDFNRCTLKSKYWGDGHDVGHPGHPSSYGPDVDAGDGEADRNQGPLYIPLS